MKVLVTGSSGFLGRALLPALRTDGHDVIPLSRDRSRTPWWDPASGEIDRDGIDGVDAVIHLAGAGVGARWTDANKARIRDSRVNGTRLIAESIAALKCLPAVLLSMSGIDYYGDRGEELLDESSLPGHGYLPSLSVEWEKATDPAEHAGIRVVRMRTGNVLGPGGGVLPFMRLPFGPALRFGSGKQYFPWISKHDQIRAMVYLLTNERASGAYNLVAPTPMRQRDVARGLGRIVIPVPAPALAVGAGSERAKEVLLSSKRVVPKRLLESGFTFERTEPKDVLR